MVNILPLVLATAISCGGSVSIGTGGAGVGVGVGMNRGKNRDAYRREIDDWHKQRIARLTADDGWLSLVGLFPIPDGSYTFGSADNNELVFPASAPAHAGTLTVEDSVVTLQAAEGVEMTHDGARVDRIALASDKGGTPATEILMGTTRFYVIYRSGGLYLRVKDSASPVRKHFHGIKRYPVSKKWCLEATFEPYVPPHRVRIPNILGFEEVVDCPGVLVFQFQGKEYRLEPMAIEGDEYSIVFGDATSGHDTYGGGRELYVKVAGPDGKTYVDFNKAYNPPCVFTHFATCPLPHGENVLPFRVEAGEKMWGGAGR